MDLLANIYNKKKMKNEMEKKWKNAQLLAVPQLAPGPHPGRLHPVLLVSHTQELTCPSGLVVQVSSDPLHAAAPVLPPSQELLLGVLVHDPQLHIGDQMDQPGCPWLQLTPSDILVPVRLAQTFLLGTE